MNTITVKDLSVNIHGKQILQDISLEIPKGTVTAIIGPSGAGKTTLLRTFNYLQSFASGSIKINDVELPATGFNKQTLFQFRSQSAMVFQKFNLFKNMTAIENVMAPVLLNQNADWDETHAHALELLDQVGLKEFADSYPVSLSGGQRQRVAIARAIAANPSVILFDEPTSALDPEMSKGILNIISELAKKHITMVIVTHEIEFAKQVSDQTIFLEDGTVQFSEPTQELFSENGPQRIKQFTKEMNFIQE